MALISDHHPRHYRLDRRVKKEEIKEENIYVHIHGVFRNIKNSLNDAINSKRFQIEISVTWLSSIVASIYQL